MARVAGGFVMTGSKHGEYFMRVEFSDERMPIPLRKGGYYLGQRTCTAMVEVMSKTSGLQLTGVSVGVEKPDTASMGNRAAVSGDELRNVVESQSSNGNSSRTAMDLVEEAPERSAGVPPPQVGPDEPVRSVDGAPEYRRREDFRDEGDEAEITEVDDYTIFVGDESNPVSLCVLALEYEDGELIATGVSGSTSEVWLCGKSGGLDVKCSITAWKLAFSEHGSFRILVKITPTSGVKRWLKLEEPRSGYKETAEDVFCAAKFLAFLRKEPHASEYEVRNHLVEGDVLSVTFCDRLRKQRSLIEQYMNIDLALKESDARNIFLSLTREKAIGKRVLLLNDGSSDEDDYPRVKKPKMDHTRPEDVSVRGYESEEEFYEDEGMSNKDDESDDEPGDSLCVFCDDGGFLLCCDGPCMRSFHPRRKDGINSQCMTIGLPDESDIEKVRRGWFCINCKTKKHQCYVCGELGNSDAGLGRRREVFVCDVASCGKFYHPRCISRKLRPGAGEREARETLAKGIRAGEESFTCPLHRCKECGKGEEKKERDLNLATCRRCPAAWHVKCLPTTLSFNGNEESHFEVRAWELGKRFIVYCTDHKIVADLGTPLRNHIKFKEKSSEATTFKKPKKKVSTVGNERPDFRSKASSPAVSQIQGGSADTARPATQKTSEDAAKRLVDDIVYKSRRVITEESVLAKLILPIIYRRKEFSWMLQGRFDSILNGARAAMERFKQGSNWEDAKLKCAPEQVVAITAEESHLRAFLAPTLHGKRYTSYGRHFTKAEKLKKVVEVLQPHIRDGDTIVDFSCGDNTFSRLLHDALPNSEKSNCQFKNFDIFTPKDTLGFERRDWLSVGVNDCGPGDSLVIGLNPPFTYTEVFISHALSMNPRVLVFIIPPLKKPLSHYGYQCVLDDPTTMAEKSFYLPGSVHGLNDDHVEQGNHVAPHLYIFVRPATFGGSNPLSTMDPPSTVNPPLSANSIQQLRKSEKRVNPATPTPQSDPSAHLFIPQKRLRGPERPQHMVPERTSRAPGFGSQMEEGEILPPPPPLPAHLSPPLLPHQPLFRSSQFHDSPRDHPSQFSPRFHPHRHPEFRPSRPLDEPYSPFEPALFPRGDPRSLSRYNPRGFPRAYGGFRPPAFGHLRPPGFRDLPPPGFRDLPPPGLGGWLPAD